MSEPELRAFETKVLGAEHAAEHARQRREQLGDHGVAPAGASPPHDPYALPQEVIGKARSPFTGPSSGGALAGPQGGYDESRAAQAESTAAQRRDATSGGWSPPFDLPLYAIHAALLPTGKVLWFGPPGGPPGFPENTTVAVLWDPATGQLERVDPPLEPNPANGGALGPANLYCAGHAFLADGQLLVTGGTLARGGPDGSPQGLNAVYTFDPFSETWTKQPSMPHGRWYPTQVLLPDGRQVIISGIDERGGDLYNETIEVFTPPATRGGQGSLQTLRAPNGNTQRGQAGMPPQGWWYPHMFGMPNGRTLVAGHDREDSWYLDNPVNGLVRWSDVADPARRRRYGNAVLMPEATPGAFASSPRVLQTGGYVNGPDPGTNTTEVFSQTSGSWSAGSPLNLPRSYHNTVLLPDGSMVAVGGGPGGGLAQFATTPEHHQTELFDPATGQWRLGAAQQENRVYHSTALLLPDGRVVSAGDNGNPNDGNWYNAPIDTAEIYEPPYLFKGPRPRITSAPPAIAWGKNFSVATPDANVTRAVLVAPSATTHATDMSQRYVPLELRRTAGGVELTAPPTAAVAPPGYYMLFLVNSQGVPSIAKFVRLQTSAQPGSSPPTSVPATPVRKRAFGKRTLVTMRLATQRVSRRGTIKVVVANRNGFAVKARLSARKAKGSSFVVGAKAKRKGTLKLSKALRRSLARRGKLSLRLALRLRDPAGNTRVLKKTVVLRAKKRR